MDRGLSFVLDGGDNLTVFVLWRVVRAHSLFERAMFDVWHSDSLCHAHGWYAGVKDVRISRIFQSSGSGYRWLFEFSLVGWASFLTAATLRNEATAMAAVAAIAATTKCRLHGTFGSVGLCLFFLCCYGRSCEGLKSVVCSEQS